MQENILQSVRFLPWVGANYESSGFGGRRILVLGESHYCANPQDAVPTITRDVIQDLLDPNRIHEPYMNTYTKFERAMVGKPIWGEGRCAFWHSISFYNYIQSPLDGPRMAPSSEMYAQSEPAYWEVVEALKPDVILCWGARLFEHLPKAKAGIVSTQDTIDVVNFGGPTMYRKYKMEDGHEIAVFFVQHPSSGFSPDYWHNAISQFLESCEK